MLAIDSVSVSLSLFVVDCVAFALSIDFFGALTDASS